MYEDRIAETEESKLAARQHVGELLGINPATLRNWIEDRHRGGRPVVTDTPVERDGELARLRKENAELRRANEILKTASAFFAAAEVDRRLR
jgi:transposase